MKDIALIFPGQGAQKVGMGKEFYDGSLHARAIFDQADKICSNGLKKVMFEGPEDQLTKTTFAQPAILTMSLAALAAFSAHPKYKTVNVQFTAGLSLGEYSALTAAGSLKLVDALRLVMKRGAFMDEACAQNIGTMAAILSFDKNKLVEICQQTGAEIANFNSKEQIVITGHNDKINAAIDAIKSAGGQKIIPLTVAGAFHSSLMQTAADKFKDSLKDIVIEVGAIKVVSNVTGLPQHNAMDIRENLYKQITASVQWVNSIEFMIDQGITEFIEIGPGKVLKGLIRRINPNVIVHNIEKPTDLESISI